jgi:hypothetical protein
LRLEDDVTAYAIDEALAAVEQIADRHAVERPKRDAHPLPDGRFATDEDFDDEDTA